MTSDKRAEIGKPSVDNRSINSQNRGMRTPCIQGGASLTVAFPVNALVFRRLNVKMSKC